MEKLAKVHMLPNYKGILLKGVSLYNKPPLELLSISNEEWLISSNHLYFTTEEDIKKDDWFIGDSGKTINKAKWDIAMDDTVKKIVATTDISLWEHDDTVPYPKTRLALPKIPQQFIDEYVKAGGINEVILECSYWNTTNIWNKDKKEENITLDSYTLKTDQNNCVIIHPIKPKLYTLEELTDAFNSAREFNSKDGLIDIHIIADLPKDLSPKYGTVGDWIKENL